MALTYSTNTLSLGASAPNFRLFGTLDGYQDGYVSLDSYEESKAFLITFICKHCPYVIAIQERLSILAKKYAPLGLQVIAICSNDPKQYPEDSLENLKKQHREQNFIFPYLVDESQQVARNYGAACTPEFYVFDQNKLLRYHGRLDDSWKDASQVTQKDLETALQSILNNGTVSQDQIPSMGCNIKWKTP